MLKPQTEPAITRHAAFSRCKTYRYSLERVWETKAPLKRVVFIGLNPSTADHQVDDPTIRRCMGFAQNWGFNALSVVNLFAYRTPYPDELKKAYDPIGPYNVTHLGKIIREADLVIACWGKDGSWMQQDARLAKRFANKLRCLEINKDGSPAHPLYQRADKKHKAWKLRLIS